MQRWINGLLAAGEGETPADHSCEALARVFGIALGVLPINALILNLDFCSLAPFSSLLIVDGVMGSLALLLLWYGPLARRQSRRENRNDLHWGQTLTCLFAGAAVFVQFAIFGAHQGYWQDMLLAYEGSIAVAAGLALSPNLVGALGYTALAGAGLVFTMWARLGSAQFQLPLLLGAYSIVLASGCVYLHRLYHRLKETERHMRAKTDIIGILLHDFEENSRDVLWQMTPSGAQVPLPGHEDDPTSSLPFLAGGDVKAWIVAGAKQPGRPRDDFLKAAVAMAACKPFKDLTLPFEEGKRWLRVSGKPVFDRGGVYLGYRGIASDVTVARESENRIAHMARHDGLTDLPNRLLLNETLAALCAADRPFTLIFIDLDGFKGVNDAHGHEAGDDLLRAVSERLRSCLAPDDLAARLGGDEFVVVKIDPAGSADAMAGTLVNALAQPFFLPQAEVHIGASLGMAMSPRDGNRPADLLKHADLALYKAKGEGRGRWRMFDPAMLASGAARHAMVADLRRALARKHFAIAYQPIVDVQSGRIEVVESLLRWNDPARGKLSPADFIPLAEESGLIVEIGAWALREACAAAAGWRENVRIAVNFSPLQLRDPGLLAMIDETLQATGLSPNRLEIEITESLFLDATSLALDNLRHLRARGVRIALDDFGTGYSSLSYLRSFPFDTVKIDRSFVRDLATEEGARAILRAITAMASSLGLKTTGEGVETEAQLAVLRASGCTQAQGYLLGRPTSRATVTATLASRPDRRPAVELTRAV